MWERLPSREKVMKGSRHLRKGRHSQKGAFYFVTTSCYEQQRIFSSKDNCAVVFESLDWLTWNECIDLYFCIIMPDHVHLVFQLTGDRTLSNVMKSMKQFTSYRIRERTGLKARVWQEQYYDHCVRNEKSLREIIQYCWLNPVRKGLVEDPQNYPFWKSKHELIWESELGSSSHKEV